MENLFYTLYARITLELAGTELCSLFPITDRPLLRNAEYFMPSPSHMYRIYLAFKDILDSPSICEEIHGELLTQYLESYIRRLICLDARNRHPESGDTLGYYQYGLNIARNRESDFRLKWDSLIDCFADFPPQTITTLSQKYLTVLPRAIPAVETPTADLPFANLRNIPQHIWDDMLTEDYRCASLAQLEGRMVGEQRCTDPTRDHLEDTKYRRCICRSICSCSKECSYDVESACPCAEWQMRLQLVAGRKSRGQHDFATRANTLALGCFHGLKFLKRDLNDADLIAVIEDMFSLIGMEVQKERFDSE